MRSVSELEIEKDSATLVETTQLKNLTVKSDDHFGHCTDRELKKLRIHFYHFSTKYFEIRRVLLKYLELKFHSLETLYEN